MKSLTPKEGDFIPHTRGMRFLDEKLTVDTERGYGEFAFKVESQKRYWHRGGFSEAWFLEAIAQGAAGVFHFQNQKKNPSEPHIGFLVGIDQFEIFDHKPVALGDVLVVKVKMSAEFYPFGVYEGAVWRGSACLAQGEMKFVVSGGSQD